MAKRIIKFRLSQQSIDDAIRQVEQYKRDLARKNALFIEKAMEHGIEILGVEMSTIPNPTGTSAYSWDAGTDHWSFDTSGSHAESSGSKATATISVGGDRILYVEFGYGVTFSNPQHPKAGELGVGAGTNSPMGHWKDEGGWWYKGSDGEGHHTYGAPAYMPVYHTAEELKRVMTQIAREVFGNG